MRRLTSIFLMLAMLLTLIPMNTLAAETDIMPFTDMKESDYCAKAAIALERLGIIVGYPDETYGATNPVTRAEMAVIVCRIIDKEVYAENNKGETIFDDVKSDHWASGYINIASQEKIIIGDGNRKFRPDDNVKFEEAIKMIVCALGYGTDVKINESDWSNEYLRIANDKEIMNGLEGEKGKIATRGDIAVMAYNGLATEDESSKIPATPFASVESREYSKTQKVKLTTVTKDADIYYTLDGTDPTSKSMKYTKEFSVSKTCTLKAIAVKNRVVSKNIMCVDYTIKNNSSGGGSSKSSAYTVSFNLNYDGAENTFMRQVVKRGDTVTEPEEPMRDCYNFSGWYTDAECKNEYDFSNTVSKNTTLFAKWYSSLYGVHDLSIGENNTAFAMVSTDEACGLLIRIIDNETSEILCEVESDVLENMQNGEVTINIPYGQLPQYFLMTGVLIDENGDALCDTYTCIDYTPEYESFMAKTVNDFPEEDVVNFDESLTNNFAILNDEVERIDLTGEAELSGIDDANSSKNILDEEHSNFQNNYFEIKNIDENLKDTQIGDILYLEYNDGFIITVEKFEITDDETLKVWGDMSCELRDYFDYIKVDMELNPDDYEEVTLPEYTESDDGDVELAAEIVDVNVDLATLKLAAPIELSCSNRAKTRKETFKASVSVEIKPNLVIKWDAHIFSEDYFEFKLSLATTTGTNASLEYSRTNGNTEEDISQDEMLEKVANIPLGKVLLPFGVTGLGASVELTVPVSVEFKASANFTSTTKTTVFVSYDTINGKDTGKETTNSKSLTVEGELEVKVGPKLEESIEFLGGVVKASLEQSGGIYLDIKGTYNIGNTDHLCTFCASGELGAFLTASAKLSYKVTENFKGTPINLTFYNAKWKLIDCYYSSISGFGMGECPNKSKNWDGQCTLSGKITIADNDTDNNNNIPLKDALVSIKKIDSIESASSLTSDSGTYTIKNVPAGDYIITVTKDKYITVTQTITIVESEVNRYNTVIEAVSEEDSGDGKASGKIYDAVTGNGINGLKLEIRKGINNVVGDAEQIIYSADNGRYTTNNLSAGNYTVQIIDDRDLENEAERYYTSSFSIKILGNCTIDNQDGVATNGLRADQLRIVLRWGETPSDLDSHIVGPKSDGGRFHVYYSNKYYYEDGQKMVDLDLDDTSSYGPETTTIYKPVSGSYTFFVHDFTNAGYMYNTALGNSGAYVEVYLGNSTNAAMTFNVPNEVGTLWTVFRYDSDTGIIEPINTMSNQSNSSNVGLSTISPDEIENDSNIVFNSILNESK